MMAIFYLYDPTTTDFHLDTGEHIYLPAGHDQFIELGVITDETYDQWKEISHTQSVWLIPGFWRDDA